MSSWISGWAGEMGERPLAACHRSDPIIGAEVCFSCSHCWVIKQICCKASPSQLGTCPFKKESGSALIPGKMEAELQGACSEGGVSMLHGCSRSTRSRGQREPCSAASFQSWGDFGFRFASTGSSENEAKGPPGQWASCAELGDKGPWRQHLRPVQQLLRASQSHTCGLGLVCKGKTQGDFGLPCMCRQ